MFFYCFAYKQQFFLYKDRGYNYFSVRPVLSHEKYGHPSVILIISMYLNI